LTSSGGVFDCAALRQRLDALETETARPDLWEDREAAEKILREKRLVEREVGFFDSLESNLEDAEVLLDLAADADDEQTRAEALEKLEAAAQELGDAEFRQMLGGENDASNAIVSINSGAGGTDACDWAEMLMRMYLRWAERHGFQIEMIDQQAGEEAGLRGATFTVKGEFAFGYLKAEDGVHRLVRISPFDSQARRHTAFASVTVTPEIDDAIEVDLDENDIRVDTYRASGAGGQHVNKTDSAIRLTHLPTGVVVECQDERSQHKNRARAMSLLKAKLLQSERDKITAEQAQNRRNLIGSGDRSERIRTYNYPQGRVTDNRINLTLYKLAEVTEGELDLIIEPLLQEHHANLMADLAAD